MSTVKIGWSGGEDSTCAVMKHIERGDKVKAVCYIPMFTRDIPLICKDHYNFIVNTAEYFRSLGAEVYFADGGLTYYEYVIHVSRKGKNKGQIFGFPIVGSGMCGFKRDGKLRALKACDVGYYDYEGCGICANETHRLGQLNDRLRSILVEQGITKQQTKAFCIEHGIRSPHYLTSNRDGCALCYNAKQRERDRWFADYPEAIYLVIDLQNAVKRLRPDRAPLRNYGYFIDWDALFCSLNVRGTGWVLCTLIGYAVKTTKNIFKRSPSWLKKK